MHPMLEHLNILDLKGETDSNSVTVGDFNTPLSTMDKSSRQKISNKILDLKYILEQIDLTNTYRIFNLKATEYTFFSSIHGSLSRIAHMLGHKTILNKFKKIEIIFSIFSDNNVIKL